MEEKEKEQIEKEIYEEPRFMVIYFDEDDFIKNSAEGNYDYGDWPGFGYSDPVDKDDIDD